VGNARVSKRCVTEAKPKSIYKTSPAVRLQRQALISITGAAIIENGKITKSCAKNEYLKSDD
jgi:hypothetical protein